MTLAVALGLTCAALVAPVALAARGGQRPMPDTPVPGLTPSPMVFPAQMTAAAEVYSIIGLVLWLTAGGFIVGLLVSVVTQKRASLWSVVTVAAFLALIAAIAVTAAPAPMPLSIALSGGFLVLTATAMGGWIGQEIWRRALRPPAPPA